MKKREGGSGVDSDMMKISIHQSGQENISLCQPPLFGWFTIWGGSDGYGGRRDQIDKG